MHSSTPNLFRAVAECTQPYGPAVSASSVRSLQSYLINDRCVDSVYRAILARACAEPQSEAVIAKCIALIKQYVTRHTPSAAVLEAIAAACERLAAVLPGESGLQRSLVYLENSVARLAGINPTDKRLALLPPRPGSSSSLRPWLHAAVNGELGRSKAAGSTHSMHSGASEQPMPAGTGVHMQRAAGSPVRGLIEDQSLLQQQQQRVIEDEEKYLGQLLAEAARVVPAEPCLPDWTFQPSALQELWLQPLNTVEQEGDLDWSLLLPQYSPSLVPLVEGLPGMEVLHMLSSRDIIDSVTDADQETQLRHMREIAEVRNIQSGVTPELLQSAVQQSRMRRARRLFQPLPYIQQDCIDVSSTDVAAIVEVMCGKPTPATPSAITGMVGLDDPAMYWQQRPVQMLLGGQQQQQPLHIESIGQISSCILVKLMVDLWLSAGGAAAFPLVLRMLQQALYQAQPEYRMNAFNIIYNLSVHGSMLVSSRSSHPSSPTAKQSLHSRAAGAAVKGGAGSSSLLQQQQQYQQQVQQLGILQRQLQQQQQDYNTPAASTTAAAVHRDQAAVATGHNNSTSSSESQGGSPRSQGGSSGCESPLASPRIHLPLQLLSPPQQGAASSRKQQQQQQQQKPPYSSNISPPPSPHSRSRLSRSDLRINAEQLRGQETAIAAEQQQQQQQVGDSTEVDTGQQPLPAESPAAHADGRLCDNGDMSQRRSADSSSDDLPDIHLAWEEWLQQLLYELLLMLAMVEEPCQEVWQAAVGCLLQLTTHAGHWVAGSLRSLPPAAAAALLDACVNFNWSQELHAHLVHMAVNLLYVTDGPAESGSVLSSSSTSVISGAAAAAVGHVVGGRLQQQSNGSPPPGRVRSASLSHLPPRQQQQRQQQSPHRRQQTSPETNAADDSSSQKHQTRLATVGTAAAEDAEGQASPCSSSAGQECDQTDGSDVYLPCQLHAGPVDEQQLAAFGGPQKLLKHFCHAASVEAQRTLLVPLLQVLMPQDAPDASQLAVLQALCAHPNCLAALQATLSAGLPGWADPILTAVAQLLEDQELDLQLLATALLRLEGLAVAQMHIGSELLLASEQPHQQQQDQSPDAATSAAAAADHTFGLSIPPEVEVAMQVTLQQLAGNLRAQQQHRPGPQGSTGTVAYIMPAEVQGSWKALKALCWCDDELARRVVRQWLQQLLALTLQQSLKGTILLPLPGVMQRPIAAPPVAAASSSGSDVAVAAAAVCTAAAINAACESWVDVLVQLVSHCPKGPDTLVDALQLHMTCCKLQLGNDRSDNSLPSLSAAAAATAAAMPTAAAVGAPGSLQEQQQQRAAVARICVQAWAFVCQWVMQAKTSISQAALTRLAAMAQSLACVPEVPKWLDALGPLAPGDMSAAAATGPDDATSGVASSSSREGELKPAVTTGTIRHSSSGDPTAAGGDTTQLPAAAAAAATGCRPLVPAAPTAVEDDAVGYKEVPPPEPSSEPSALAALWAAEGQEKSQPATTRAQHPEQSDSPQVAAAAAVFAAAEAVCWPQQFLLGCALLPQQMAQVLSGASLALLLVRLLQCKPHNRAADRGFHGRPSAYCMSQPLPTAATAAVYHTGSHTNSCNSRAGKILGLVSNPLRAGRANSAEQASGFDSMAVLPCPVLYPWSDGRQDLQLGLMLMLMSSCSTEAENFVEFGLEAVTQQVLSRCGDPRACLLASQFMLEHLMRHQQERYWTAVRQLIATAQQANDERLLGNPFLQLITLLSQQQQQQGGEFGIESGAAAGSSYRSPLGLGMGWTSGARV